MNDRLKKLLEVVPGTDKVELVTLHNGVVAGMKAYQEASTAANKRDWDAAKSGLQEAIDRLWPKHFGQQASAEDVGHHFKTKGEAFAWYCQEGGQRAKSSFYANIPSEGKRVSRFAVSEMLRKERGESGRTTNLAARKEELEVERLEQQVKKGELENRKEDSKWVLKEEAEIETAALVGLLQDTLMHRIHLDQGKLLHAAGGDPARAAEFAQALEDVLAAGFNEVAAGKRFEVGIEEE